MKRSILFLLLAVIAGCSIAPMMTTRNARTLGEGGNKMQVSPALPVLGVSYERGLTENWDMGLAAELQLGSVYSAFTKYAFINTEDGFSLAMSGGGFYGSSIADVKSRGFYAGPVVSWRKDWFEVFLFPRYNYVHWQGFDIEQDESETDDLAFDLKPNDSSYSFRYLQVDLGFNFYTNARFNLGVGASYIYFLDSDDVDGDNGFWLPEFMIGWAF